MKMQNKIFFFIVKVTTKNFQFLSILAAPLDKSGSYTSCYCSLLACALPAMCAFVSEVNERNTTG